MKARILYIEKDNPSKVIFNDFRRIVTVSIFSDYILYFLQQALIT